jgi:uncharacterized protein (DUF2267 family)
MRYATFMTTVEQVAGIAREEAERAVRATLETLAERITRGEADDIAAFLPKELRPLLTSAPEPAEGFGLDEFLRRVAQRAGVDAETAREYARAVFTALGVAVAPGEVADMVAQLPKDYMPLLRAAGVGRRRAAGYDLVRRASELGGMDEETARRAMEAVLETLAFRISHGEVDDLARELPPHLREPLQRGLAERRDATPMSADEFVARVAQLEGVAPDAARRHARAVFAALREYVSGREFRDMASQLSEDYAPLLAAAG